MKKKVLLGLLVLSLGLSACIPDGEDDDDDDDDGYVPSMGYEYVIAPSTSLHS
jgi:protein involved in sex pheromone biosynthesis